MRETDGVAVYNWLKSEYPDLAWEMDVKKLVGPVYGYRYKRIDKLGPIGAESLVAALVKFIVEEK